LATGYSDHDVMQFMMIEGRSNDVGGDPILSLPPLPLKKIEKTYAHTHMHYTYIYI
jgi:hypothetical protein